MKEIIRLDDIRRDFRVGDETVHALRGVTFTICEGEFVTIMGTSGSGKSTLLNTLGCLDTPSAGEYYLDGTAVRSMDKNQRATLRNRKIAAGRTIIFVTHTPEIAQYSSRNITLRDGRVTGDVRNAAILDAAETLAQLPEQED